MSAEHVTPNPHDAEETLRPYLGRLFDADLRVASHGVLTPVRVIVDALDEQQKATRAALDVALGLLGVRS